MCSLTVSATLTIAIVEAIKLICHEKIQLNLAVYAVEQVELVSPFQPREPVKVDLAIFGV